MLTVGVFGGCGADPAPIAAAGGPVAGDTSAAPAPIPVAEAPVGRPAWSTRVRFVPGQVVLPGGASAPVEPASTVDGQLKVPENVRHVGWWDGSAAAGDPYGHVVIAGHVDSATDGLGFFARLLKVRPGDRVSLRADSHHLSYRVTSVQTIRQDALATGSDAFEQDGPPRLVLITCGGRYRRDAGGYDSNVVIIAKPVGLAR